MTETYNYTYIAIGNVLHLFITKVCFRGDKTLIVYGGMTTMLLYSVSTRIFVSAYGLAEYFWSRLNITT